MVTRVRLWGRRVRGDERIITKHRNRPSQQYNAQNGLHHLLPTIADFV
jgi:hypothetical protein